MKIVIAAWHLKDLNVGLGRYCRGLIEAIGRVDAENQYEILMPDDSCRFPARPNMRYRLIRFPVFKRRFWEQVAPTLVGSYDVLHIPYDTAVALKRGKVVVTIHDVKPLLFPSPRPRTNLNQWIERLLVPDKRSRVDHVLTDSESSRRDIMTHLGFPPHKISVVHPGVELERFRPGETVAQGRPYVLCVAGADPTKNVETLVAAFSRLPKPLRDAYDLVLAGDFRRRADLREYVARSGLQDQTIFTGIVSDDRLVELYQQATLFVFPSRYEGFGLPVLEAMACGCPVISSNASSLPEVTGEAAILIDPLDATELARAMVQVLSDPTVRRHLRERGLRQAARFSWERAARDTIAVYEQVMALA